MFAAVSLSIGAINALIPVIVILILIAAAAGLTRGAEIFRLFGVSTLLGIRTGRGTLSGKSPFKAKARVAGGGGAGLLGKTAVQKLKAKQQASANNKMVANQYAQSGQGIINSLKFSGAPGAGNSAPQISSSKAPLGPNSSPTSGMVQMSTSKILRNHLKKVQNPDVSKSVDNLVKNTIGKAEQKSRVAFKEILDKNLNAKAEKAALDQALKTHVTEMTAAHENLLKGISGIQKNAQLLASPTFLLKNPDESLKDKLTLSRQYRLEMKAQETQMKIDQIEADQKKKAALEVKAQSLGSTSKLNEEERKELKSFGNLDTSSYVKMRDGINAKIRDIEKNNKELYDKYHENVKEIAKQQVLNKYSFSQLEKIKDAKEFKKLHKG